MLRDFSQLDAQQFDVLVCGGGIYGAWTAYDAALRGLKVAVVDQGDWGGATSSASSKLIHGGLRYLESFDFKLVRKTLAERQMLLKSAAHRIWPLHFGIPVYQGSRLGSFRLAIGLTLYDLLAGSVPDQQRFRRYSAADFADLFRCLDPAGLKAGFTYFDAQTDDARLVLELIDGAQASGAVCVNYCKVTGLLERDGQLYGAGIQDMVTGATAEVCARQIVNTAGQWSARVQKHGLNYRLSKGVHLVMPKTVESDALLLTARSDGRVFFLIPWYGLTLIGTTDSDYNGDIDRVEAEDEDIDYLLTEANHVLKDANWTRQDIIGSYAGLRVLKQSGKTALSGISRDWELKTSNNGLLSSIGGKLTSARADAETIVDTLCRKLNISAHGMTFGKPFPWLPLTDFQQWTQAQLQKASSLGIDQESALWLLRRHGDRVSGVFGLCGQNPEWCQRIMPGLPFIVADLVFCAQQEMVVHLEDLLRRRIPLLILSRMTPAELCRLAEWAASALAWDPARMNHEIGICRHNWQIH